MVVAHTPQVPEEKNKDGNWVPKGTKPVLQLSHQQVRLTLPPDSLPCCQHCWHVGLCGSCRQHSRVSHVGWLQNIAAG